MNRVRVFNGFVPDAFPAKHQNLQQMNGWRDQLKAAVPDIYVFENWPLKECWLYEVVQQMGPVFSADHPNEPRDRYADPQDAVISQCVLHQRFEWLQLVSAAQPDIDTWVWLEPTIFKQRGITATVIHEFLHNVAHFPVDAISLPGVWPKHPVQDHINHWRFCGSCWVCPSKYATKAWETARDLVKMRVKLTNRICWDNSTWSYIELLNVLPMRWYPGNHDETQLTGYMKGIDL